MANSWAEVILKLEIWSTTLPSSKNGINTPVNLAKATATAAITPVCITKKTVQPYTKAVSSPNAFLMYTNCPPA